MNTNNGGFKLDGRTIAIGLIVIVVVIFLGGRLLGGGGDGQEPTNDNIVPTDAEAVPAAADDGIVLGELVTARTVDRDNCPQQTTTTFEPGETIYVVAPGSSVVSGTEVFARLYFDGTAVEDADEIVANQDYDDTCIFFQFEPSNISDGMQSGNYEAQFFVNGNPADSVNFSVR